MASHFKHETPWEPFQSALEEYPELQDFVSNFQVELQTQPQILRPRHFKDSIVVFKKKKLPKDTFLLHPNIYNHDTSNLELDALDANKSRSSCLRCRKFKKKCTRDLPECLNCESCDEICIYISRKRKGSAASTQEVERRESAYLMPSSCPSQSSIDTLDTKITTDNVKSRQSIPTRLNRQEPDHVSGQSSSTSSTSDLYRLLN